MLVVMKDHASSAEVKHIVDLLHAAGAKAHLMDGLLGIENRHLGVA